MSGIERIRAGNRHPRGIPEFIQRESALTSTGSKRKSGYALKLCSGMALTLPINEISDAYQAYCP